MGGKEGLSWEILSRMRKCFKIQVGLEGGEWDEVDVSKEWWVLDMIQKFDVGAESGYIYIYIYI